MKHKHHNPPQHRVGKHDTVIELSITQHAMFHYCEWCLHGLRQDWLAWKSLSRQIDRAEIQLVRSAIGGRNNAGKPKTAEHRAKMSESARGGFHHTPESKEKHRKAMMGNTNSHSQKSPEARARHSEIMKAAWARRKNKRP